MEQLIWRLSNEEPLLFRNFIAVNESAQLGEVNEDIQLLDNGFPQKWLDGIGKNVNKVKLD